jgi:flagellar biosynthesis anti-sigma factor FlgM
MRISNGQVEKLLELQLKGAESRSPARQAPRTARQDSVSLSRRAADVTRAKELAASAPEVREDQIAAIRERMARGDFEVSADKLADTILREARLERILRKL